MKTDRKTIELAIDNTSRLARAAKRESDGPLHALLTRHHAALLLMHSERLTLEGANDE